MCVFCFITDFFLFPFSSCLWKILHLPAKPNRSWIVECYGSGPVPVRLCVCVCECALECLLIGNDGGGVSDTFHAYIKRAYDIGTAGGQLVQSALRSQSHAHRLCSNLCHFNIHVSSTSVQLFLSWIGWFRISDTTREQQSTQRANFIDWDKALVKWMQTQNFFWFHKAKLLIQRSRNESGFGGNSRNHSKLCDER